MADGEQIRVFANGCQYADWRARNCDRCVLFNPEHYDGACELDGAIGTAFLGDGSFTPVIAKRLGYRDDFAYTWDCPERQLRPRRRLLTSPRRSRPPA